MKLIKDKDLLYVADSYYGIFKIDLLTGNSLLKNFNLKKRKFEN